MNAVKRFLTHCKRYVQEGAISTYKGYKGEYLILPDQLTLYDFNKPDTIKNFVSLSDAEIGGKSTVNLTKSKYGRMLFSGNVDINVPDNVEIDHSGFCGIRSNPNIGLFDKVVTTDMSYYDCVEIKYRGDGRPFFVNIQTASMMLLNEFDLFQAFLFTKGGPNWEVERIPFTKFLMTYKGYLQDEQFDFDKVRTIGISLSDKKSGPYSLEVEYLKLVKVGSQPLAFKFQHFNKRFQDSV